MSDGESVRLDLAATPSTTDADGPCVRLSNPGGVKDCVPACAACLLARPGPLVVASGRGNNAYALWFGEIGGTCCQCTLAFSRATTPHWHALAHTGTHTPWRHSPRVQRWWPSLLCVVFAPRISLLCFATHDVHMLTSLLQTQQLPVQKLRVTLLLELITMLEQEQQVVLTLQQHLL